MKSVCLFLLSACILFACKSKAPQVSNVELLNGKWKYAGSSEKTFSGNAASDLPELVLETASNKASGTSGCNNMFGSFTLNGSSFSFGPIAGTKKMCPNMEMENYLLQFYSNTGSYKIDDGKLFLYDKADKTKFIVFTKVKA